MCHKLFKTCLMLKFYKNAMMACNNIYQQFVHTRKEEFSQLPIVNPVSYFLSMLGTINKRRFSSIEITTIGQS